MNDARFDFTADWVSPHIPALDQIIDKYRPKSVLEIGCFEGRVTCYMIDACTRWAQLSICCIDTWGQGNDHPQDSERFKSAEKRFDHNVAIASSRARNKVSIQKLAGTSANALARLAGGSGQEHFDLIYIDGSHVASDVLTDALLSFMLLKVGGVLIFDDYLWLQNSSAISPLDRPKLAIDAFINIFSRHLAILPGTPLYQLYVEKLAAR